MVDPEWEIWMIVGDPDPSKMGITSWSRAMTQGVDIVRVEIYRTLGGMTEHRERLIQNRRRKYDEPLATAAELKKIGLGHSAHILFQCASCGMLGWAAVASGG